MGNQCCQVNNNLKEDNIVDDRKKIEQNAPPAQLPIQQQNSNQTSHSHRYSVQIQQVPIYQQVIIEEDNSIQMDKSMEKQNIQGNTKEELQVMKSKEEKKVDKKSSSIISQEEKKKQNSIMTSSTKSKDKKSIVEKPIEEEQEIRMKKGTEYKPKVVQQVMKPSTRQSCMEQFNVSPDIFIHLRVGSIGENYKVGQVLGEGAFGQVFKVTHKATGMIRAMKTLKKSSLIKEEEEKLFSEMNILKNLDHPNILKLIELFQDSKNYYLITEYCSGGELFDKIKSMSQFTEKMAADYMKQILSAVVYCHANSIVHRDLKPENLIFDSDKKNAILKVIDFGTSRKIDKSKKMTKLLGTPYYIAPEVIGKNYDEKCDVWSCGVILYIMLCGYPPFSGRNEDEILKRVKIGKFKFDPQDWDKISNDAKQLIQKMLTYDPKKRISAQQALNDQWVQKNAPSIPINQKSLQNLAGFYSRSKIKQAIMTFIVSQIVTQNEKEELQKSFRSLDINGDGILSKDELIQGYFQVYGDKEQARIQVEKILAEVDANNSGKVDFTASNNETILSRQKIEQAFKMFDQDGNGNITKEELGNIMGNVDEEFWKEVLLECDTNKDGQISLNEFCDLLVKRNLQA